MHFIVYKTTNLINGKVYIGAHKTDNLDDEYLGSGKQITAAILKYRSYNFKREILFSFDNSVDMYSKEAELVTEEFCLDPNTYNIKVGGQGGWDHISWKGVIRSEESRRKMSASSNKWGENNSFYGKTHSEASLEKISKASKARGKTVYNKRIADGNHPNNSSTCPHCNKIGQYRAMKRWHFENCKKINEN